jgi:hypothetical protein
MTSPAKKPKADPGEAYRVGPSTIIDVFNGFLGSEESQQELDDEFFEMTNHEKRVLEKQKDRIQERQRRRQERADAMRRKLEEQRFIEKRNNPENLAIAAAQIQKLFRAVPLRRLYERLVASNSERPKKHAMVISIDAYEDTRVRDPTIVCDDAFDIARAMQHTGFHVDFYSTKATNAAFRPTKANISRALEHAVKNTGPDTMLWVHICGSGGIATVSGKNPFKAAAMDLAVKQTPRTRMIRALQTNHRAPGQAGGAGGGDLCKYILPSDARSSRLTYDTVISYDELLNVVDLRHCTTIHGCSIHQRVLTVDAVPFGTVEGQQGGGYGLIASTATGRAVVDLPTASQPNQVVETHRGILSRCVLRALLGDGWTPIRARRQYSFKLMRSMSRIALTHSHPTSPPAGAAAASALPLVHNNSMHYAQPPPNAGESLLATVGSGVMSLDATMLLDDEDDSSNCLGVSAMTLVDSFKQRVQALGLTVEESGRKWGDIPLISGSRATNALTNFENIFGCTVYPAANTIANLPPLSNNSTFASDPLAKARGTGGGVFGLRRKAPPFIRSCSFEVTYGMHCSAYEPLNVFDHDLLGVLFHWTSVLAQPDPSAPAHRWLKLVPGRAALTRRLCIGIAGSFVDVATRLRAGRGGESLVWAALVERLTAKDPNAKSKSGDASGANSPLPTQLARVGGMGHGSGSLPTRSVMLPPIHPHASSPDGSPSAMDVHSLSQTAHHGNEWNASNSAAISPVFAAAGVSGVMSLAAHSLEDGASKDRSAAYQLLLGKAEEGGICLAIDVRSNEEVKTILSRLNVIPEMLEGLRHQSVRLELSIEMTGCIANVEILRDQARGWFTPVAKAADEDLLSLVAKAKKAGRAGRKLEDDSDYGPGGFHKLGVNHVSCTQMTSHLERLCQGTVRRPGNYVPMLAKGDGVSILRVVQRAPRINDIDDTAYDAMRTRERPLTIQMPYPSTTHMGMAICVVAMHGTPEHRARQVVELAKCAKTYELYCGIQFMVWEINELLWTPPGVGTSPSPGPQATPGQAGAGAPNLNATLSAASTVVNPHGLKRDKVGKLLEALKGMIPSANIPALLVLDLMKKRYYQTRLGGTTTFYTAEQISRFCDDYSRGSLNDLMPPVKGCRVYGGSIVRTKYTLIAV